MRSSLAGPRWVGCSRGGQGAARVLAAVGTEGNVACPEGRGRVVDRELHQRYDGLPVAGMLAGEGLAGMLAGEGVQNVSDNAIDALYLVL